MAAVKKMISLPPELEARVQAWIDKQTIPPTRSAVIQRALMEFLDNLDQEMK